MREVLSRVLAWLAGRAEDALDAGIDVAREVLRGDERAYKHLLWQMREDAGSDADAWAGPARDADLEAKYATVDELLDAMPRLAQYRDSRNGEGPLFWASFYGPLALVERLVSMGADPHATLEDAILIWYEREGMHFIPRGCTTLMMAAAGGQTEIVRYLLDRGVPADVVARDEGKAKGQTALFVAARDLGNAAIVRMLVEAGADPNLGDDLGFTPAGKAARRGAGGVLEALAEAGADLRAPSGGRSVMELAGEAADPSAMRPLVRGRFGRVLTLDDVTRALDEAGIAHEAVLRTEVEAHGADLVVHMSVCGRVVDDDHPNTENSCDYYVWSRRSWNEISAIDLDGELEDMGIPSRRFASDGEMKSVLGIAAGGVTPFGQANDRAGRVVFRSHGGGGEGKVALEAFDAERVVVLEAEDVPRALSAFADAVGPPPKDC